MNLNDLDIFCAIIDEGSLNKAAKTLGYAQSNVSARLKALEQEFHTTLLVRGPHGVTPNPAGEQLYRASVRIAAELDKVRRIAAGTPGDLLVTETLLHYLMTNDPRFSPGRYGAVAVRRQSDIIPEARRHQYDTVISFMDLSGLPNYRKTGTMTLEAAYLAGTKPARTHTQPVLVNCDRECAFRKHTLADLKSAKSKDNRGTHEFLEVDSLETIITMVEQGRGIALLPSYLTGQRRLHAVDGTATTLRYTVYRDTTLSH